MVSDDLVASCKGMEEGFKAKCDEIKRQKLLVRKLLSPVDTVSVGVQCEIEPLVLTKEKIVPQEKIVVQKEVTIKEVVKTIEKPVINERTTTVTETKEVPVTKTVIKTVPEI